MSDVAVVDLSHWNDEPDWAELKAGGVAGVILKATEDGSYVDPTYAGRVERAAAAGLLVSTYHFMRPGTVEAHMRHYLDVVRPVRGARVCLDHEDPGVSLANLEAAVQFLLAQELNLQVCIYSGHVIKDQLGNKHSDILAKTSLWVAQYTSAASPSWPKGTWPAWSLWQFTDKAKVPGCPAPVDGNRWNGSPENLAAWFGPAGGEPAPAPLPQVEVAISCPEGVELVVKVNGFPVAAMNMH